MEPISYQPPIVPNQQPSWTLVRDEVGVALPRALHLGDGFVPDGSPVSRPQVSRRVQGDIPEGSVRDCLFAVFKAQGVTPDRSAGLANLLAGVRTAELWSVVRGAELVARAFPNTQVPEDDQPISDDSEILTAEAALRTLVRRDTSGVVYVVPSELMDYVRSLDGIEVTHAKDAIMFQRVVLGEKSSCVSVPAYNKWDDSTVDSVTSFVSEFGPRVVSFPIVYENIARCVYRISKYSFGDEGFRTDSRRGSINAALERGDRYMVENGNMGPEFALSVSQLLATFQSIMTGVSVPDYLYHVKPHVIACVLMRESTMIKVLLKAYVDYCVLVPKQIESFAENAKSIVHWEPVVRASLNVPSASDHPQGDPIPTSYFGKVGGAVGEIAYVMEKCGMMPEVGKSVVVAGPHLAKKLRVCVDGRSTGLEVKPWFSPRGMPAGQPFQTLANYAGVVIARGEDGAFNDAPNAMISLEKRGEEVLSCVVQLCGRSPDYLAICGPLSQVERVPKWLSQMGSGFDITLTRANLGVSPHVWALGVRSEKGTPLKSLKAMMDEVFLDLHLCQLLRDDMMRRGSSVMIYRCEYITSDDKFKSGTFRIMCGGQNADCDLSMRPTRQLRDFFVTKRGVYDSMISLCRQFGK